ncbi:MAG: hypothetical protein ACPGVK_07525 [Halocynthiibacter sp.]
MRKLLILPLLFTLANCINIESTADLNDEEMTFTTWTSSQLLGQSEGNPREECEEEGGAFTLDKDGATCVTTKEFSLKDWIKKGYVDYGAMGDDDVNDKLKITVAKEGWGKLRFTMDTAPLLENEDMKNDMPEGMEDSMKQMVLAAVAGKGVSLKFKGDKIVESNGQISQDGTTVNFYIPMSDLIDPENRVSPDTYTALIKY